MAGKPVPSPCEEIRMFSLCARMKWNHLPNAGGLYDQDPVLLDKFNYIFSELEKREEAERNKQKREAEQAQKKRGGSPKSRLRGGRR